MNKSYFPSFGLEIHLELLTKTKAFSNATNDLFAKPNTNLYPLDLGYPGAKPTVNLEMVILAIKAAKSFNMELADELIFDRKNYFYPDLAKGFQLTQFYKPLGRNGHFVIIFPDGREKTIKIRQLHIEEDTAKQIFDANKKLYLFDFNRSGVPLIEIITDHNDFETVEEVCLFIKQIRQQLIQLKVSDAKLENGSMRIDVNVSVSKKQQKISNHKVEIKNLNSITNIETALNWELRQLTNNHKTFKTAKNITKRFDEASQTNIIMRDKSTLIQYNYLVEGNILPINIKRLIDSEIKLFSTVDFYRKYQQLINPLQIIIILNDYFLCNFFLYLIAQNEQLDRVVGFITTPLKSVCDKLPNEFNNQLLNESFSFKELHKIYKLALTNKITKLQSLELLTMYFYNDKNFVKKLQFYQQQEFLSITEISKILDKIWVEENKNPNFKLNLTKNPVAIARQLMGKLMKQSGGKVNPVEANQLVLKYINEQK